MVQKKLSFITTTINKPTFIEGYLKNAEENGHLEENVEFLVVGDLKTPSAVPEYCKKLSQKYGYDVKYMGVEDQLDWSEKHGIEDLNRFIPFNSIQRRNLGYLKAYDEGADVIVSLDDDNLAQGEDIVGKFAKVGEKVEVNEADAPNNWYNCCSMMEYKEDEPREIYPRGFPYSKRDESQEYSFERKEKELAIRAGLWLDVPDVDVITHLERAPRSTDLREKFDGKIVSLAEDNYCPVNTQNTGFDAKMLPLVFAIPMGDEVKGMEISRFDDIWLGYFAEKILHSMDKAVGFGEPLSDHDRNTHHLKSELEHEAIGIRLNEVVIDILEDIEITEKGYLAAYEELIENFEKELARKDVDYGFEAYLKKVLDGMRLWHDACSKVMR